MSSARRTREIAIHMATGATPTRVLQFVLQETTRAALAGVVGGATIGAWLSRWLESLLFGVRPGDWATTAALLMLVLIVAAALWPAVQALRLSPTAALRVD